MTNAKILLLRAHTALSPWYFLIIMIVFMLQAGWIAITRSYPMLFDESTHFGMSEVMTSYPLPYIPEQLEQYDTYGYVAKGNTSLFYYFMSIPLRIIELFTDSLAVKVVLLRP